MNESIMLKDQDGSLESVVGDLLRIRLTLATAESCTGGTIGALLTSIPGSSDYYRGGVICYQGVDSGHSGIVYRWHDRCVVDQHPRKFRLLSRWGHLLPQRLEGRTRRDRSRNSAPARSGERAGCPSDGGWREEGDLVRPGAFGDWNRRSWRSGGRKAGWPRLPGAFFCVGDTC